MEHIMTTNADIGNYLHTHPRDRNVFEILLIIDSKKTKEEKINVIREHIGIHEPFKMILLWNYIPSIETNLPEGIPPYTPNDNDGDEYGSLWQYKELFRYFVKCEASKNINEVKKESLYIEMLEGVTAKEALVILAAKDGNLNKISTLTNELILESSQLFANYPDFVELVETEKKKKADRAAKRKAKPKAKRKAKPKAKRKAPARKRKAAPKRKAKPVVETPVVENVVDSSPEPETVPSASIDLTDMTFKDEPSVGSIIDTINVKSDSFSASPSIADTVEPIDSPQVSIVDTDFVPAPEVSTVDAEVENSLSNIYGGESTKEYVSYSAPENPAPDSE